MRRCPVEDSTGHLTAQGSAIPEGGVMLDPISPWVPRRRGYFRFRNCS
jgi:hypothetical protein